MAADGSSVTPCSAVRDARKRADIKLTYIVDVEVTDEAAAIKRLAGKPHCGVTPDMAYHFVTKAPEHGNFLRPVVIGMGPCGLFAGLILAQMGFRPIILERGKCASAPTPSAWRKSVLNPESNVQFGEGGAGRFPTASCTARSRTRTTMAARCWTNSSRPVRQTTSCI